MRRERVNREQVNRQGQQDRRRSGIWSLILVSLLGLGLLFRLVNLEQKVFWVDEVATAIRIAGHTRTELTEVLSDGVPRHPADLLAYQQLDPDQSPWRTFSALSYSPEHAPLYFLLLRGWAEIFGSSVVALRSFSVLCSLLLLGAIYRLGKDLGAMAGDIRPQTRSWATGAIACGLTALSPLFIAYSQEARPYSLWLLLLTLNSTLLLDALRSNKAYSWLLYGGTLVLGLYTSLLTVALALGQAVYVGLVWPSRRRFGLAWIGAIGALLPWLGLMIHRWQTLQHNTTWMRLPLDGWAKLATWFYTVAVLYFDVPVVTQPAWIAAATLACATAVVSVVGFAFYWVFKNTSHMTYLFLLVISFSLPVTLIVLELAVNGRFSTAPRYLLPFHLGAQLAMALLLDWNWDKSRRACLGIVSCLLAVCLLSNLLHLDRSPRYLKTRSLNNPAIAEVINQAAQTGPLLLAEAQNTMDLLSLSHNLASPTQIKLLPPAALLAQLQRPERLCAASSAVFLFNPSPELKAEAKTLLPAYQPSLLFPGEFALSLWRLPC